MVYGKEKDNGIIACIYWGHGDCVHFRYIVQGWPHDKANGKDEW